MRRREKRAQAIHQIFQELKSFGRIKSRKGDQVFSDTLRDLEEQKIVIQSRRENSIYWYPSEKYEETLKLGPEKYLRSRRKIYIKSFLHKFLNSHSGRFLEGLFLGLFLGAALMYLILEKLLF